MVCPKNKEMTTERICVVSHEFYDSLSWEWQVVCYINAEELSGNEQNKSHLGVTVTVTVTVMVMTIMVTK